MSIALLPGLGDLGLCGVVIFIEHAGDDGSSSYPDVPRVTSGKAGTADARSTNPR